MQCPGHHAWYEAKACLTLLTCPTLFAERSLYAVGHSTGTDGPSFCIFIQHPGHRLKIVLGLQIVFLIAFFKQVGRELRMCGRLLVTHVHIADLRIISEGPNGGVF